MISFCILLGLFLVFVINIYAACFIMQCVAEIVDWIPFVIYEKARWEQIFSPVVATLIFFVIHIATIAFIGNLFRSLLSLNQWSV